MDVLEPDRALARDRGEAGEEHEGRRRLLRAELGPLEAAVERERDVAPGVHEAGVGPPRVAAGVGPVGVHPGVEAHERRRELDLAPTAAGGKDGRDDEREPPLHRAASLQSRAPPSTRPAVSSRTCGSS